MLRWKSVCPVLAVVFAPLSASAQETAEAVVIPAAEIQILTAVAPLPEEFRATATVLGYRAGTDSLVELRAGDGPYICLASVPGAERFHVACYHESLEAFMARGRELRRSGVTGEQVDTVRYAEIAAGTLKMPASPAALYSMTTKPETVDLVTGVITGGQPLYVVYMPFATPETTGISAKPAPNTPWLMYPGTPKAHIMFVPRM